MATKTEVPITGSVLTWAMAEAGYDTSSLAQRLRVDAATVAAWEEGRERPGKTQFRQLVDALRRPSAIFFLPGPPVDAGLPAALRSAPGVREQLPSPSSLRQIRRARRLQTAVAWVTRSEQRPASAIPQLPWRTSSPLRAGEQVRHRIGPSLAEQLAWRGTSQALREWRAALDSLGVLTFALSLAQSEPRGFSAWDDHAPMVAVNTTYNESARVFTMAHELGHLVSRTDSACRDWVAPDSAGSEEERWCERFAAAFLLPPDEVVAYLADEQQVTPERPLTDFATLWKLSRRLKVSARALALTLIGLDLAPSMLYSEVERNARTVDRPATDSGGGGQPRFRQRLSQYGTRTVRVMLDALDSGRLGLSDVADYLGVTTGDIDDLAAWRGELPAATP